jgi:hypothetical protein
MKLEWTDFKTFVTARSAYHQHIEVSDRYYLFAFDGPLSVSCELIKSPSDTTDLTDWTNNYLPTSNRPLLPKISDISVNSEPSFKAKSQVIGGVLKKFYARNTGKQFAVTTGSNELSYTATFAWVKMIGVECVGAEALDTAELLVYDNALGTYSGVPNALLNQFGYTLNMAPGFYSRESPFDADVYAGMIIKINYVSVSNKTVGVNFIMNEVKS